MVTGGMFNIGFRWWVCDGCCMIFKKRFCMFETFNNEIIIKTSQILN